MTYMLHRGSRTLGRIEARVDVAALNGILIPSDAVGGLRGEWQKHISAMPDIKVAAAVFSLPEEPVLADGPPPPSSGGSFALQPVGDDAKVKDDDLLRIFRDEDELRVDSVILRESRYLHEIPADERRGLPQGALQGRSYWTVTAFLDRNGGFDDDVVDDRPDEISP